MLAVDRARRLSALGPSSLNVSAAVPAGPAPVRTTRNTGLATLALPCLVGAAAAYQLAVSIANPMLIDVARDFSVPLALAAQARTIGAAAACAVALIAIFLADRAPRRMQLLWGLTAQAVAAAALAAAHSFGVWLVVQAAYGGAAGLVGLAGTAAVGDYVAPDRRASGMAWITTGYGIAFLAGLPLVGWLATTWGWRTSYLWAGAGTALAACAAVALCLPPVALARQDSRRTSPGWRQVLTTSDTRGWLVGELLSMTGWSAFLVYVGPFFGVTYGLGPKDISVALAVLSAIAIVGVRASVPWSRRWGLRRVLLASTFISSIAIIVPFALHLSPALSLAAVLPFTFFGGARHPTSSTLALTLSPDARGSIMAARGLVVSVAGTLAGLTGGIVLTVAGFWAIGPCCAALLAVGGMTYARTIPADRRVA